MLSFVRVLFCRDSECQVWEVPQQRSKKNYEKQVLKMISLFELNLKYGDQKGFHFCRHSQESNQEIQDILLFWENYDWEIVETEL